MRAFFVPSSSNEESIKIQSSQDRYAHWKQRGSTKVLKAASERSRVSPCQAGSSLRDSVKIAKAASERSRAALAFFLIIFSNYV